MPTRDIPSTALNRLRTGCSSRQATHQEPQKLTTRGALAKLAELTSLPVSASSGNVTAGQSSPPPLKRASTLPAITSSAAAANEILTTLSLMPIFRMHRAHAPTRTCLAADWLYNPRLAL